VSTLCTHTQTVSITQPPQIIVTATHTNLVCYGDCNAGCTVTANPSGTYQYSIDGGITWQASNVFGGLCGGAYTVMAKNGSNCTGSYSFSITQPPQIIPATIATPVSCYGNCNGSISTTVTPAGTYQYSINGGITWQASNLFSGLCPGTYTITVKNGSNCTGTSSGVTITEPLALTSTIDSQTNITCNGGVDGTAAVIATGGTGTLIYNWTPGNPAGDGTNTVNGLSAGTFVCTITDSNNCTTAQTFLITEPSPIQLATSVTDAVCFGDCNGQVNLSASPAGIYQFSMDSGATWISSGAFTGICAGAYMAGVQDAAGCNSFSTVLVNSPPQVQASAAITSPVCNGICSGNIVISVSPANIYSYSFDLGNTFQSADSIGGICDGGYNVVVMDPNGCTDTLMNLFVLQPPAIAPFADISGTGCGLCNGAAVLSASGGTSPYVYSWTNTVDPQNLCSGSYTVLVTDANNCTDTLTFIIPSSNEATIDSVTSTGTPSFQSNGTATVFVSGNPPFVFAWDAAAGNQTTQTAINLAAGNYCVTITDADGCSDTACVNVPVITAIADANSQNNFSVFPNPFSDELFISGDGVYHIYLYNTIGQVTEDVGMITLNTAPLKLELDKKLSAGIYFIRAENAQGTTIIRLVKE
jgi:hypothetical protein